WKKSCDAVVKWDRTKFTISPCWDDKRNESWNGGEKPYSSPISLTISTVAIAAASSRLRPKLKVSHPLIWRAGAMPDAVQDGVVWEEFDQYQHRSIDGDVGTAVAAMTAPRVTPSKTVP